MTDEEKWDHMILPIDEALQMSNCKPIHIGKGKYSDLHFKAECASEDSINYRFFSDNECKEEGENPIMTSESGD